MPTEAVVVVLAVVAWLVAWQRVGSSAWWVPGFAFSVLGGHINIGAKIYSYEIGFLLSLIALAPSAWSSKSKMIGRPPLHWSVLALAVYMTVHAGASLVLNANAPGAGTIVRHYLSGLWAVVFVAIAWWLADLRHLSLALIFGTVFTIVRVLEGLLAFASPDALAAQQSNLMFSPGKMLLTSYDLRVSAPLLMSFICLWWYRTDSRVLRVGLLVGYASLVGITSLSGSRLATGAALVLPLIWAVAERRIIMVAAAGATAVAALIAINVMPSLVTLLPASVQRSVASFRVMTPVSDHDLHMSDVWHYSLLDEGFQRWTASARSLLVGNRVEGWRPEYERMMDQDDMRHVAARLGSYENALCTVTAILGAIGLALFVWVGVWVYAPLVGQLRRERPVGVGGALGFVAVQSAVMYVGLSWIGGSYPSAPLLWGVLASACLADRLRTGRPCEF